MSNGLTHNGRAPSLLLPPMPPTTPTLRQLTGAYFRLSGAWGLTASLAQLAAVLLGAVPLLKEMTGVAYLVAVASLAYVVATTRLLAEAAKRRAELLLRRSELEDGLGEMIPPRELADLQDDASWLVNAIAAGIPASDADYASEKLPSPARLVENIYESAWWTFRLAKDMRFFEAVRFAVVLGMALLVLRASTIQSPTPLVGANVVELSVALILFLLTQTPLRRIVGFHLLVEGAAKTIATVETIATRAPISRADALSVATQYQLIRHGAPLIPPALWRFRRKRLNTLWSQARKGISLQSTE